MDVIAGSLVEKGWIGVIVLAVLYAGKLIIDRWKPRIEREADALTLLEREREACTRRLDVFEEKLNKMQKRMEMMQKERHRFYDSVIKCIREFPQTNEWWRAEMDKFRQE